VLDLAAAYERELVGAVLTDPDLLTEIDLSPSEFQVDTWRKAWAAIQSSGEAVELFAVAEALTRETGSADWVQTLGYAMQDVTTTRLASDYAAKIRDLAQQRRAMEIAEKLTASIQRDGLAAIDDAIRDLMAVTQPKTRWECGIREALKAAIEVIEEAHEKGEIPGITTGLNVLDEALGGFRNSDLYVIAARPSMGKTAFLLQLALRCGVPLGVISSEQPRDQVAARLMAMDGKLNASRLRSGALEGDEWVRLTATNGRLMDREFRINDCSAISIAEIQRQARVWVKRHGIQILFVDYIQRIHATDKRIPRHEQVGEVVTGLKDIARELNIPVVALAQVNRDVEKRTDKRPNMGDIKDSGTVEQEADNIMTLYRDEVYREDSPDKGVAEIDVVKNRHGPTGCVRAVWMEQFMRFEDYTPEMEGF
jgi:replicative DNA helicase